jgi:hypothetical protein
MFYILVFAAIAVLLVSVVLIRNGREGGGEPMSPIPPGTAGASRTPSGSAARRERKKRRAQSRHDRRKRH